MVFINYQYCNLLICAIVKSYAQTVALLSYTLLSQRISSRFTIAYAIKRSFLSEYKLTKTCEYYKLINHHMNLMSKGISC